MNHQWILFFLQILWLINKLFVSPTTTPIKKARKKRKQKPVIVNQEKKNSKIYKYVKCYYTKMVTIKVYLTLPILLNTFDHRSWPQGKVWPLPTSITGAVAFCTLKEGSLKWVPALQHTWSFPLWLSYFCS